jgi:hypothetical protein
LAASRPAAASLRAPVPAGNRIRGTVVGPFETPAGVIAPSGVELDIPTADFWYLEDGKIKAFNCYVGVSVMLAQLGVTPDFASAVAASAAAAI